ncbi:MAG: VWA domain-containing protein [Bacteroidales bacterium]|nr:VWA domain-containing protein [Bacteroidales bacterium]
MNVYNVIILDESGSMSSIYRETLTGVNEVLNGIRKNQEDFPGQQHQVTIVTFEGNGVAGVKVRRDRVPIGTVEPFTEKDYRPGGCTPLYDAMGKTLNAMEGLVGPEDKVMVTVITDGFENSSREYSGKIVRNMVERLRKKGWVLAYIGANQDSVEAARDLSIGNALDFEATPSGMQNMACMFRKASRKLARLVEDRASLEECDDIFDFGDED